MRRRTLNLFFLAMALSLIFVFDFEPGYNDSGGISNIWTSFEPYNVYNWILEMTTGFKEAEVSHQILLAGPEAQLLIGPPPPPLKKLPAPPITWNEPIRMIVHIMSSMLKSWQQSSFKWYPPVTWLDFDDPSFYEPKDTTWLTEPIAKYQVMKVNPEQPDQNDGGILRYLWKYLTGASIRRAPATVTTSNNSTSSHYHKLFETVWNGHHDDEDADENDKVSLLEAVKEKVLDWVGQDDDSSTTLLGQEHQPHESWSFLFSWGKDESAYVVLETMQEKLPSWRSEKSSSSWFVVWKREKQPKSMWEKAQDKAYAWMNQVGDIDDSSISWFKNVWPISSFVHKDASFSLRHWWR